VEVYWKKCFWGLYHPEANSTQFDKEPAYIEQKNWTYVRKLLGYLGYDTFGELMIINDLYRNEVRLYKNFFQPVMKLISKDKDRGQN
jgi:hypothetical protein